MSDPDDKLTVSITDAEKANTFFMRRGKLEVVAGPDQGKSLVLDQPKISIGSLPDNGLVLTDSTISRHHAVLTESAGGYLLKDLKSTNGTLLNGLRIREAYLQFGGMITVGETQISCVPFDEKVEVYPSTANVFGEIYGRSVKMRTIFAMLERVSKTNATIILEGETGTGKELVAKAIHDGSPRDQKPFVVFDCGAVAQNLIESELFGHEKGAFTGSTAARDGVFQQARGGTIFIDEIGELSLDLQPKLLRVLESREVKRVGANRATKVDVRIIAATNRDLQLEVKEGRFREDLFYRLSVFRINIPPLRDRKEDIPLITTHLIRKIATDYGMTDNITTLTEITPETHEILKSHSWPGNVRELRNVLGRALAMGDRIVIQPGDLLRSATGPAEEEIQESLAGRSLEDIEKTAIIQTLKKYEGNKSRAAKALGIAYSTLHEKIKKYHI